MAAIQALGVTGARADEKQQCMAASDQGQELRDDGSYRRAREAFSACARNVCPPLVRRDCANWLSELEEAWPSVILGAKDGEGNDLVDVQVELDGQLLVSKLDGNAVRVEPGEHLLRFQAEGRPPIEEHVVVRTGEKNRMLDVRLGSAVDRASPRSHDDATPSRPATAAAALGARRTSALVFGAISLVAFSTEAYFGITGMSDRHALLAQPCAQTATCSSSSVDSVRTKFTVADISLGVGLTSAALAVYLYLTSSGPQPTDATAQATRVDLAPLPGGGAATVAGRF